MYGNWTKEQVRRAIAEAFYVEKRSSVALDCEHADYHNIKDIIRWAKEMGFYAEEHPHSETVVVHSLSVQEMADCLK